MTPRRPLEPTNPNSGRYRPPPRTLTYTGTVEERLERCFHKWAAKRRFPTEPAPDEPDLRDYDDTEPF